MMTNREKEQLYIKQLAKKNIEPTPEKYIKEYEKLGIGMFVHWGIYSQLGKGEQAYKNYEFEECEYKRLMDTFKAENFCEEIVTLAKESGFKYIVLTTRHHDGFSLYDTKGLNDYDAVHSAAGRDLIKQFTDCCRKNDIKPFLYHTTLDWLHPDFDGDFDKYLEYLNKSVELLCTNYGEIGGFWFDGNWSRSDRDWKEEKLYSMIRHYQPNAIISNNPGMAHIGEEGHPLLDTAIFEQGNPKPLNRKGKKKYLASEMCQTVNNHWGYGENDIDFKSPREIIENLCSCRKIGTNYLLNIGPNESGAVDPYQRELIKQIGKWIRIFGDAIYDVEPYSCISSNRNFILKSGEKKELYIFVFDLGINASSTVIAGGRYLSRFNTFTNVFEKIKSVKWMDNDEKLDFVQDKGVLSINTTGFKYGTHYVVRVAKAEYID